MAQPDPAQSERDPDCYCASQGLPWSCLASAGELCNQPGLGGDLAAIRRAAATIDPSIDILAEMHPENRP